MKHVVLVKNHKDGRTRLYSLPENRGDAFYVNRRIRPSSGTWPVCYIYVPDKLSEDKKDNNDA